MDCIQKYQNENFTSKVEDTIELSNGGGELTMPCRRVPLESARSLESVLGARGRLARRPSTPLPAPGGWGAGRWGAGSGSDVTVARLRDLPGDGPHRPASPSLVNLATFVLRPPKYEDLVPVSSWDKEKEDPGLVQPLVEDLPPPAAAAAAACSHRDQRCLCPKNSDVISNPDRKSKFARFLRLYFCPCCTCLYEMEQSRTAEGAAPCPAAAAEALGPPGPQSSQPSPVQS